MEDNNPDSAASPATPGTGKSKLDALSKEDLIKFTKKQMVVLQKVKARCADLEQEVEKLQKKSSGGADEAIIQELTERMDAVLLEKAETQQRLVLLRKENEKAKQEAKDALDKVTELQKQFDLSNVEHLKKIENVKHELETVHSKHKEEAADFQKLLQESSKKEQMLTAQFRQQLGHQNEVKELEEQFKLVRQKYEDQLSSLQQQLISFEEERRRETTMLKEIQEASIAECQKEIESLRGELLKIRIAHQDEVKELVDQLESAALEHEQERYRLLQMNEDLTVQLDQKENSLQDVEEEEETGIEWVKKHSEPLFSVEQGEDEVINLKYMLKDLQSQHSILQDELTYLSNVKTGLELELQQAKDEFLHEKEELEFNINELQLCKEDNDSIATKCKSDLQTTNDHWEMALNQHEQELQVLKQRHQKEIVALEQTLLSTAEKEKGKALLEIQNLKEECEKLSVEKDEAVDSYEKTMEILRNVQSELSDTTGHFVKQYNAMKESNAAEIHELQQKLRVAFNEKDKLLERINNLESEARPQQDTSESDWENKKQELLSILHHKDTALRELEEKLAALNLEKDDMLAALKHSEVEVEKLRDACSTEQEQCVEFQQNLTKDKTQIKALEEELMNLKKERDHLQEKFHLVRLDRDSLSKFKDEIGDLEKSSQAVSEEKERLRKDLEEKQQQLTDFQHRLEYLAKDNTQLQQRLDEAEIQTGANAAEKESISHQLEILENKVAALCLEKEQKCSDLKALEEDLTNLKKERDETGNLEKSFPAVSEEKERLRKDLEEKQQQLAEVRVHIFNYLQQEAGIEVFSNNDQEVEVISVLVQKLWDKVMEGKRSALLQSDERIAQLQDDIESLREEGRLQEVELRSFNDDLSKERTLLKENLEEVLSDKEGLQRDLLEMKNRNEKMRVENEALLAQIEAVSEKLKEIEKEKNDEIDQTVQQVVGDDEREKLLHLLAEKESELSNLQGEIVSLQESKQNSSPAEEVIRELTDKIGNLEKEHKEKHEKMNKIKAVAVKAKKELDTTRKEVQALKEELELVKTERERLSGSVKDVIQAAESYKNLLAEYDKQTEQLDLEKERGDNCDRQIGELTKHLQAAVLQKDQLISEKEDQLTCLETLQMNVKQLEAQILELQKGKSAVEKELEGEKLLKEHKIKDHSMSLKEIEDLQRHLQKQNQQLQQAVQELELLRKDAQQSSLMDMEMADYERLVKELNQNISDKESRIEEYEGEIKIQKQRQETLQEEISSMKSCLDQTEDKNTKIKQLLVKTKKELADTKKSEANQLAIQSSLKGELEASQQQLEDYKIQCADLTAERHKLQEQLRSMSDQLQRAKSAFQQKIATLQEECTAAKAEQVSTASEFESYKVRVHNVLKQQKNKSASQNEKDAATQERECMERMMDQLKAKLQETQHSLQANMNELQALQSEHDTLLERHNKMLQETVAKEAELGDKLRSIQSENMVLKSEHAQTLSQLTDQNEALRNSFREQVRHLQEDHRKTVETLQQQVSKVEAQLFQLQKEASTTSHVPVQQTRKILQERKNADLLLFDLQSMAREEGEGMETTETESVSSSGTHIPSLELLLNSPEPKMDTLVWQAETTKEELAQELNTATKSIEHMNGLLHDTEATNAILMEQITLLKSEVRRLERNQEREKSVANLEYLKNVLLQFIFLKSGSERQALLPVIHTMLQLSPEERSKLSAIAQGEEEAVVASRSSGWTSYLHSWSGIR